ncbi:VWA domain-containing protein [Psychrobium sp. 1_MG-2023]|uniref:vWA domain-containing protein n=1 Tax=Psychrobium sp. 1_MG-2023 TaxID=3062624 RepID=UPI000C3310BE|nr:VWA domain-containing protein [Psychrobium sp. 1_MG-2023]MDP2561737.1 VWA domain-containing protein [Psychrobium sp. 1_MG-2023]PKF59774.1 IMP dehydrogenase [Alteromonadales bacterium alter-6D02]
MLEFSWSWVFFCLPLPLLCYFLMPAKPNQQIAALKITNSALFPTSSIGQASAKKLPLVIAIIVWFLLLTAAARPQWVGEPIPAPTEARELILAVDLSASMQEEDMKINGRWVDRLTMVKAVLSEFIKKRQGDRIGLILFADNAYVQAPLTFDLETVETLLDESFLGLVGQRTAIGEAIGLAVKRFDNKKDSNRVLVLLTDGENTAGNISPQQALELAIAKEVTIYTIGVGSDKGRQLGFFNRGSGIDEDALTQIALATKGQYFRATDTNELEQIYQQLDQLEKIEANEQTMRPQTALFFWPLSAALLLSMLALALHSFREKH